MKRMLLEHKELVWYIISTILFLSSIFALYPEGTTKFQVISLAMLCLIMGRLDEINGRVV